MTTSEVDRRVEQVRRLLAPRNVVIVGATERTTSWASRIRSNLKTFGYEEPVYAVNPKYETLWGDVCYPAVASLPEPPDHLVVLTPAETVDGVLRNGAKAGARSATVFASGFGEEGDAEGAERAASLKRVIRECEMAVSGPNCLGNISAPARLVTLTDRRLTEVAEGPIAIVAQSGGVAMAINRRLTERGVSASYVITSGNEFGLSASDYLDFFVRTGEVKVVAMFLEGLRDATLFLEAAERARAAGLWVVAVKIGGSERSRQAALAHTGALAGSLEAFDAVAGRAGVLRVNTIDELVDAADGLCGPQRPAGPGVAAITFSGGARGLLEESAERQGVQFATLEPSTLAELDRLLGVGGGVGNPLDAGYTGLTDKDAYLRCVDALLGDKNVDILLAQGELPQGDSLGTGTHKEATLLALDAKSAETRVPTVIFSLGAQNTSEEGRELRRACRNLGFVQGPDRAVRVSQLLVQSTWTGGYASEAEALVERNEVEEVRASLRRSEPGRAWNEPRSKELLRTYGFELPREVVATSAEEAVLASESIGYPVTLKLVLAGIGHKTELGGVILRLSTAEQVRDAYRQLEHRAVDAGLKDSLQGILVTEHVTDGLEVALGLHRDVEVGPVIMVGLGGLWLEVLRDVAFGAVPLSEPEARRLIASTRVSRLLTGARGEGPKDEAALVGAVVALSHLARDLGDALESVDVNPLAVLPQGRGAKVLDALVIPRAHPDSDVGRRPSSDEVKKDLQQSEH